MADHGFGKTLVSSSATDHELDPIVDAISELPWIIRVWILRHAAGNHTANIGFKFKPGHPDPDEMVRQIEEIIGKLGHTASNTDIYIKTSEQYSVELEDEQ